ncbi:ATP-binding protein, partial [Microbacterium oxydans]|uniref:ATP-binding protein n=1 Tax=Microbacterium oxydans TaxID=82380 RepID=UPI0024AD4484
MTMVDTLFGLIPAGSRGQQWIADELQLINWGGYDGGPHRVRFSPNATLLCGGSGSGKSTLMDAYIALMMPHTTPFNGASNGGVTGRPRGEEQRNILSYGRGKIDESRTEDGTKLRVLRGDGEDTWSAIATTWLDHDGSRFTAVRAWYIPADARVLEDTTRVRATVNGAFDLAQLEKAATQRLSDASVRAAGLETLATDREFSARLQAVLGIGAAGSGAKAISLLARIQAGQQITTVDDLYKKLVLEEPETMATADAVVAHFDELESTRTRMLTAKQQVSALEPIRGIKERIAAAAERVRIIDEVGVFTDPSSLAALWNAQRRLDLLREVEVELGDRSRALSLAVREKRALVDAADAEREGLLGVLRQSGGDRLETAQRELRVGGARGGGGGGGGGGVLE